MKSLSGKKKEAEQLRAELAEARESERQLMNAISSMYSEVARLAMFSGVCWPRPDVAAPADVMAIHVADMTIEIKEVMKRLESDAKSGIVGTANREERNDHLEAIAV